MKSKLLKMPYYYECVLDSFWLLALYFSSRVTATWKKELFCWSRIQQIQSALNGLCRFTWKTVGLLMDGLLCPCHSSIHCPDWSPMWPVSFPVLTSLPFPYSIPPLAFVHFAACLGLSLWWFFWFSSRKSRQFPLLLSSDVFFCYPIRVFSPHFVHWALWKLSVMILLQFISEKQRNLKSASLFISVSCPLICLRVKLWLPNRLQKSERSSV